MKKFKKIEKNLNGNWNGNTIASNNVQNSLNTFYNNNNGTQVFINGQQLPPNEPDFKKTTLGKFAIAINMIEFLIAIFLTVFKRHTYNLEILNIIFTVISILCPVVCFILIYFRKSSFFSKKGLYFTLLIATAILLLVRAIGIDFLVQEISVLIMIK